MVMITRSAHRKASQSFSSNDISQNENIPPWCSSGKVAERKPRKVASPSWEIRSSYPLRENIWEYLYEDKSKSLKCGCKRRKRCKQRVKHKSNGKHLLTLVLAVICLCVIASLWMVNKLPQLNWLPQLISNEKITYLTATEDSILVDEECCRKMRYLAVELYRTQKTLSRTLRVRREMMPYAIKIDNRKAVDKGHIADASVTKGRDTIEWGGRLALWGVVPLWRAAPPPDTVLSLRKPTPADCWPFRGSRGEINIELVEQRLIQCISIEHVQPDTAQSAPKEFMVYGILENGTWIIAIHGQYYKKGPAKQYYQTANKNVPLKHLVFRVLSNQGNPTYTCLYRIHVYSIEPKHL
ncbi:SUN domain-containing protein 3-like [Galleria mellonella]|uniref:SUN domain-containing protein 3-like n=1 Tax=Galleria mellonella TaxID=7137 RepID=A0ABM3N7E8_GALME|nr:SUN domain-containing protein 3-like [Galleria mellonella]